VILASGATNTVIANGTLTTVAGNLDSSAALPVFLLHQPVLTIGSAATTFNLLGASNATMTYGNTGGTTGLTFNSGTNGETHNLVAAGQFKVVASASPTNDMVFINTNGQAVNTTGASGLQITFLGGTAAGETSAQRIDLTAGGQSGSTWNGYRLVGSTPASGVTENGIRLTQ